MGRSNPSGNDELLVQLSSCKTMPHSFRPTCSLPILFFISVNITKLSIYRDLPITRSICRWDLLVDLNVREILLGVMSKKWFFSNRFVVSFLPCKAEPCENRLYWSICFKILLRGRKRRFLQKILSGKWSSATISRKMLLLAVRCICLPCSFMSL